MTNTNKAQLMVYPTEAQKEDWEEDAEEMGMSRSEWVQAMVEAGRKKFDAGVEPDETLQEVRKHRNDLKEELDHARDRIQELENQLHHGEQEAIREFVRDNPGASFDEITRYVVDTVPQRVNRHLDELEGDALYVDDDEYYPKEDG